MYPSVIKLLAKLSFDDQRECRQIVVDTTPYEHFLDKTDVEKVELWAIRGFMLIASALPLFAVISALCGNRFCGYVQMVVSGFFGAFAIWTFVTFYFSRLVSLFKLLRSKNKHFIDFIRVKHTFHNITLAQ